MTKTLQEAMDDFTVAFHELGRLVGNAFRPAFERILRTINRLTTVDKCSHVPYLYASGSDITSMCEKCGKVLA